MNHSPQKQAPPSDPVVLMEQALERAIELSPGTKHYPITDGRLLSSSHRSYRYVFTLDREWDVADGTDLTLKSDDQDSPVPVELADSTDTQVEFVVAHQLSEGALASATLVVERAHLLRKMKDGLSGPSTPTHLGRTLFGVEDCADTAAPDTLVKTIQQNFVPDEAQRTALLRSLASDLLLILGPPGTGKTDVLAAIALLHVGGNVVMDLKRTLNGRTAPQAILLSSDATVRSKGPIHSSPLSTSSYSLSLSSSSMA